tara:strand:- start:279 stop:446 length:168 start_codon:yes stop_codon:yes gene_type:complete
MTKSSLTSCNNCGRPEHTDRLVEQFIDGDGKEIEVIVCDVYNSMEGSVYERKDNR